MARWAKDFTAHSESDDADGAQSLDQRAARAARAELRGERHAILGATGLAPLAPPPRARRVPERWSFIHVMERMEEAFRILGRLPMATRPRGYVNSMPIYLHDRGDLNSQLETYELERMVRVRNRVRIPRRRRRSRAWRRRCTGPPPVWLAPNSITWRAPSISARCGRRSMPMWTGA